MFNYIQKNQFTYASMLFKSQKFPQHIFSNELCKYYYYESILLFIQQDYRKSLIRINEAQKRSPQQKEFQIRVQKLKIIISLFNGKIIKKSEIKNSMIIVKSLYPYIDLLRIFALGNFLHYSLIKDNLIKQLKDDNYEFTLDKIDKLIQINQIKKLNKCYTKVNVQYFMDVLRI